MGNHWIIYHDAKRFYRYIVKQESDEFIGKQLIILMMKERFGSRT
jgi:hypothetical protein